MRTIRPTILATIAILASLCLSCNTDKMENPETQTPSMDVSVKELIPVEQALETLQDFLTQNGTRAGAMPEIENVETYYEGGQTRGEDIPDAYLVNFTGSEGFAVLGANTLTSPIVALTSSGSISARTLNKVNEGEVTVRGDGDILTAEEQTNDELIGCFIRNGVRANPLDVEIINHYACEPLMNTAWGQGEWGEESIYNKYCRNACGTYAMAGCSMIAIAQIMAFLHLPEDGKLGGISLDYNAITRFPQPDYPLCPAQTREQTSRLIAYVFDNIRKASITTSATGVYCKDAETFMRNGIPGMTDVQMLSNHSFDRELIVATSKMLREGKPVYVAADPSGLSSGHAWVIDGAKYATKGQYRGEYLLHCNWGWEGIFDGYFSTSCFDAQDKNAELDIEDSLEYTDDRPKKFDRRFKIITYSLKSEK